MDDFGARLASLLGARNADPFGLLGPHPVDSPQGRLWSIRAFQPRAIEAQIILHGKSEPILMRRYRRTGFFEATLPAPSEAAPTASSYRLRFRNEYGDVWEAHDTYAFPYLLTEFDLYLMGEGRHYDTYEKLGAHVKTLEGVTGVHFALWAPNARRVSVVGDFNGWDGRVSPMRSRGNSGIWELFIPEFGEDVIYKYEIVGPQNNVLPLKADPYGFRSELRPNTGSVVARVDKHSWSDADWMQRRSQKNWLEQPISVYEVHLGSWRRMPEETIAGSAIANSPTN